MEKPSITESSLLQMPQGDTYKQYAESSKYQKYSSVFHQQRSGSTNAPCQNDTAKRSYS